MKPRAEQIIDRYEQLLGMRKNFESYWQTLHDYFYVESPDYNATYYPGTELNTNDLYDSTTLETADVLASGFMNYLTPPTSKWFRLRHKENELAQNKAVADYLEDVAREVQHALNKSNFYNEIITSYKSSGVYGTSILLSEEDVEDDIRFYSLPIKQCCIVDDSRGRVAEYYIEFEYTALQAEDRWGEAKLSEAMKEDLKGRNPNKKYKFILLIAQRHKRDITKTDKANMRVEAVWVDKDSKSILEEGGYNEFPAMTHRFDKRPFIPWGFSPAMKSLPFARLLNASSKTNLRAMMKLTDPPIAIPENAFIMPFNANPRAVNYYNRTKMESSKDIFAFGNFGNPQVGMSMVEYYTLKVKSIMFYDVFLAFDTLTKQMNNPEVMERINEKMTMLAPAVGRYCAEILNPIIIRTIGVLFRRGKLPPPPDEMIDDPSYEIDYVSQLAQAQRRSELNSLTTALGLVGQMAQFTPEVLDKVDADRVVNEVWGITGAPIKTLRDDTEVDAIRQNRAEQQQAMQQVAVAKELAGAAKDGATAESVMQTRKEVFE